MSAVARYWNLWRIDPAGDRAGYQRCPLPLAEDFCRQRGFGEGEERTRPDIQADLLSSFQMPAGDAAERSLAGLCLRCYVSEAILKACRKIDCLFGSERAFTYRDLLPLVLDDDGKTLLFLDSDGKTPLVLERVGTSRPASYACFSMQVLRTFQKNDRPGMSLDNWAYLQTKQNPELKNYLSEFGFHSLSDWALLNRTRSKEIERLSERVRHLIEVFHAVYRRDRREGPRGAGRCLDPTPGQLQEMIARLCERDIELRADELMAELRGVARQLRDFDIWQSRVPLEFADPETGERQIRADLPQSPDREGDVERQEQREWLAFFHEQLQDALVESIGRAINERVTALNKSKAYSAFVDRFLPGLYIYYRQGIGLKEIATRLEMSGWAQARRILNPGELIDRVRGKTIARTVERTLGKAVEKGLTRLPPPVDYLENLTLEIEALVDAEIFREAFEEIQSGKNRSLKSVYARQLCHYLEEFLKIPLGVP